MAEGDLSWGDEHTMQYTDDALLQNCAPEAYRILVTKVTPIKSIKIKKQKVFL